MSRFLLAPAVAGLACLTLLSAASAGVFTFSGEFTATACGPYHDFPVVTGESTIDVAATATLPTNDIVLELHFPQGNVLARADTGTSPEAIHYSPQAGLTPGTYSARVCPFATPIVPILPPTSYVGTVTTSAGPPTGGGGVGGGGISGDVTVTRATGSMVFAPATFIDPQRTEGEPLNFVHPNGTIWETGPWGISTNQSFLHRSDDRGDSYHIVSSNGLRPDPPPGGGDSDVVVDDQGYVYFTDLESLGNLGQSVSNDGGNTWRKNPVAVQTVGVDREWFALDNGTTGSAADNTIFLGFRDVGRSIRIYSTPGSTGATDPIGGLVYADSAATPLIPLTADTTCGQLRFDPVHRNLYYPCTEGDHVRMVRGHVNPGQRTGILYSDLDLPRSPGGGDDVGEIFVGAATDRGGNVYAVWVDDNDRNVYYSASTDQGKTWTNPARVNAAPSNSNVFAWAAAGAAGNLVVTWLGTDRTGDSNDMPNWAANPQEATAYQWYGYVALISGANTLNATIAQQRFTAKPMHYGQICTGGIGCTTGGDRTMADYHAVYVDPVDGGLRFVFNDTTTEDHGAHLYEVRQLGGPNALGGTVSVPAPAHPMGDRTGDAQWPHYGPGAPGANQPQLDLAGLRLSASGTILTAHMTMAGLPSLAPPAGKTSAVWLTRFQALTTGTHDEEAYSIFYLGAESAGGGALRYFAGRTVCTSLTTGCKYLQYPATVAATGSRTGNTISVSVDLASGFGEGATLEDDTLYSVTAFTFGRNDTLRDFYADVDATRAFTLTLGTVGGGGAAVPPAQLGRVAGTTFVTVRGARAIGWGSVRIRGKRHGWFRFDVRGTKKGFVKYVDRLGKVRLRSTRITSVLFNPAKRSARIKGVFASGRRRLAFTLTVVDVRQRGRRTGHAGVRGDVFALRLRGYSMSRTIDRGNINVVIPL